MTHESTAWLCFLCSLLSKENGTWIHEEGERGKNIKTFLHPFSLDPKFVSLDGISSVPLVCSFVPLPNTCQHWCCDVVMGCILVRIWAAMTQD